MIIIFHHLCLIRLVSFAVALPLALAQHFPLAFRSKFTSSSVGAEVQIILGPLESH